MLDTPTDFPYKIKILRSGKRQKTISARLVKDAMVVRAPAGISERELGKIIDKLKERFKKQHLKKKLDKVHDLKAIAERLNKEYFNGRLRIKSIEYVTNQNSLFGSCNYKTERIRISHRLAKMPDWVRNYVVLHEMAHLVEPNHSKAFWNAISRYKLAERAKGYLMAKGFDDDGDTCTD